MKTAFTKAIFITLAILACTMLLCACRQDPKPAADVINFDTEYPVEMKGTTFTAHNTYKSDYFREDSSAFNKDLALLSLSMCRCSTIGDAFSTMGFDTPEIHENKEDDGINRCSYFFAHRTIDGTDLVAVIITWCGYGMEWASNFTIGEKEEGKRCDHEGFDETSEWLYGKLKEYIDKNYAGNQLKIWIGGYSRGGGLADCLTCKIIEKKEIKVDQKDLYAYAIEASMSIDKEYVQEYKCLHNFVVDSDLFAALPSSSDAWGLARPGTSVVVSTIPARMNEYLKPITGDEQSMPFSPDADKYPTPEKFIEYLMDILLENGKTPLKDAASFRSRQAFYDTVQERLTYLLEILMKNSKQGLWLVVDQLKEKSVLEIISLISTEGEFYPFVSKILTDNKIDFDPDKLENACTLTCALYSNYNISAPLVTLVASAMDNLKYLALCHYPEVVYVLLQNYGSN